MDTISDDLSLDDGFDAEAVELGQEISGLKLAVNSVDGCDEGADEGVEELENTMRKLQAVKDMGADMPESERRTFAAKAVKDIMKAL